MIKIMMQCPRCKSSKIVRNGKRKAKQVGVLKWVIGDRSQETFRHLWKIVRGWGCFLYITDGWKVYPCFINDCDHLVSKTAMTRVQRRFATPHVEENSRLRHYLARLHRKTFCYSKSIEMLEVSIRLLTYYLKYRMIPTF